MTEPHVCGWGSITWDGVHDDNVFPDGDDWVFEQHGTCECGRRVKEVFTSDSVLRDLETGDEIEGA